MIQRTIQIAACLITCASLSEAEIVEISIPKQTTFGDSVFMTGSMPLFGFGTVEKSIKLSPHNYPDWKITLDLPPGLSFQPRYMLRKDANTSLPDPTNFTNFQDGPVIQTSPTNWPGQKLTLIPSGNVTGTIIARVTSGVSGVAAVDIPFVQVSGQQLWEATIPANHVALGKNVQIVGAPESYPVMRTSGAALWYRHGQVWQYQPPTTAPAASRQESFTFVPSNTLFKSRTIRVWLPRDYARNTTKRYPVLYAQDGQNVFSPGGSFGSWDLDIISTQLIASGDIPEVIIVGIDNTADRLREYIPEYIQYQGSPGRGGPYLSMVRAEIMPEINSRYRTMTGPAETSHIGSSLGGVLGFEAAFDFDNAFGAVVAMSPSFWLDVGEFSTRASAPASERARLYIDSGTAGTSSDGYADTITIRDVMISEGNPFGRDFMHQVGLNMQHNEAAWRSRSPEALRWIYAVPIPTGSDTADNWILSDAKKKNGGTL